MKYFIANFLFRFFDIIFLRSRLPGVPIILYHAIGDNQSKLFIRPMAFVRQMRWLSQRGFRSILPSELAHTTNQDKVFLITFDDGFKSVHDIAFPILRKYGFRAAVFLPTDYIGQTSRYAKNPDDRNWQLMNQDDIKDLAEAGWCVANHFASHSNLTTLSPEEIHTEHQTAAQALEQMRLGASGRVVAYPFNRYNAATINILRQAGVAMAFNGGNRLCAKTENPLALPRFEIDNRLTKFSLIFSPSFHRLKRILSAYV